MCEAEPYFADMSYVLGELKEAGALTEDQAFTFDSTLQQIGIRLDNIEQALKSIEEGFYSV